MKTKAKRSGERLRIDYLPISKLVRAPRNPKGHDLGALHESLERNGYIAPIILNETTGKIVAGHGRLDALQQLKASGAPAPDRVQVTGKDWLVPVVRGVNFASDADAEAYVIGDNQLTMLGGWDEAMLAQMLSDLAAQDSLLGTGFDSDDLDNLLRELDQDEQGLTDPDAVPPLPAIPISKLGDLWTLGGHRLVCGDATNKDHVARVLAGVIPKLMVTDPPYGVDYDHEWRAVAGVNKNKKKMGVVTNDDRADWSEAWRLFEGNVAYVWHAGRRASEVQVSLEASGFIIRNQVIWAKDRMALSRGDYHWQHEPCWYAVREGRPADRNDDRTQTTLWTVPARDDSGLGHSTQKPLEVMLRPIRNHHAPEVYDPFLGTGTTIIAAEKLSRRCYGLEIDPGYCDVIVARWEQFTGKKAVRA